jgi:hypothetical protein
MFVYAMICGWFKRLQNVKRDEQNGSRKSGSTKLILFNIFQICLGMWMWANSIYISVCWISVYVSLKLQGSVKSRNGNNHGLKLAIPWFHWAHPKGWATYFLQNFKDLFWFFLEFGRIAISYLWNIRSRKNQKGLKENHFEYLHILVTIYAVAKG